MSKYLVAANWKMHGSKEFNQSLLADLTANLTKQSNLEVAICPPFVYLDQLRQFAQNFSIGAQNISSEEKGAFTGEISGTMLSDLGCKYVIIGHSERRALFNESDELIAEKFKRALANNLIPILCVGELKEQRENKQTLAVIEKQLEAVIKATSLEAVAGSVIAYEPVWAIGTGLTASPSQAEEVHSFIRNKLGSADTLKILYGGSVKPNNAADLISQNNIDGFLVGGASLVAADFINICTTTGK